MGSGSYVNKCSAPTTGVRVESKLFSKTCFWLCFVLCFLTLFSSKQIWRFADMVVPTPSQCIFIDYVSNCNSVFWIECLFDSMKLYGFPLFFMFLFSIYAPDSFISLRFFLNLQILEKLFIFIITKVKKRGFLCRVMLFWLFGFDLSCISIFFDTVIFIVEFNRRFFNRYWILKKLWNFV